MADPALVRHIKATMPKFNPLLAEGFAVSQIPLADEYVHMLFLAISKSFPSDLVYEGYERCTPMEEFKEITKKKTQKTQKKNHKSTYDIARSDLYLNKYKFRFKNNPIPITRFLFLPFVTDGGHITISASRFTMAPVLSDRVISVLEKSIFVRLIKTRFMVYRLSQHYLMDGQDHEVHVAHSKIYQKQIVRDRSDPLRVDGYSTMPHYLFCKFGLVEAFRQFANCTPVVGDDTTITTEHYPKSEWHICTSTRVLTNVAPPGRDTKFYIASKLRIAIRKSERTPMVEKMLGGFFYLIDLFPERMRRIEDMNNPVLWIQLLGYLVAPSTTQVGKLLKEMDDHMRSLDEYIDAIMQQQLSQIGMEVDNVYQLFAILTDRFNKLLLEGSNKLSSMYDKELNVNYFVLYEISKAIVALGFRMMKLAEKPDLAEKEVINAFTAEIKPGLIYNINKNVGSVAPNSYPGDNKALKITTLLTPQQASNKKPKGHSGLQLSDPINSLHVSVAEIGGYANLPKSQPSGHFRLSLYVNLDRENVVQRNPAFIPLFDQIQKWIDLP